VPGWAARNPFILSGYRAPGLPLVSLAHSALPPPLHPLHNQTLNILTHLVPGVVFFLALCFPRSWPWPLGAFDAAHPDAPAFDRALLAAYVAAVVACLALSAAYHTLACRSEAWHDACLKLDYVGITVVTAGSFVPGIHLLFYCDEHEVARWVFWGMVSGGCFFCSFFCLSFSGFRFSSVFFSLPFSSSFFFFFCV
jgi:adiponectin receptor